MTECPKIIEYVFQQKIKNQVHREEVKTHIVRTN
jgi:hypothetical protein